ncbi:hypothetical protein [Streptococcus acidominimus]|uniref:Uncharacterized protein n=1 Tax=Streptococcus acidominimus TaxID=1326 RepID=A0A380ID31_STRAI|nr:hypothetical protein [Streptococcus acidominimus]SUN05704.1 Uncharacterised protein [Streptococcus acidominimus]
MVLIEIRFQIGSRMTIRPRAMKKRIAKLGFHLLIYDEGKGKEIDKS